ncbi:hypothetical protein CWE13_08840 [Aliidiomarina shirensis]|uniref:Uncharacterized protein n=1 Tax=Aliidiomarina shirensis TaxID=1048642 RepID=A0A432WT38_9GAMM|nr:hypothetical protein [Aliidiomarina shirensis]RUO36941.1 hypothetical protein CWE13_08840 [Aliidiomarina shirensis]
MEQKVRGRPSSIAEAISLISISEAFNRKSERLIKRIFRSHIDVGSTEYKQITEDAISDVSTSLLEMASREPISEEWYLLGLETYGTPRCTLTPYMYRGVGYYAKTRFKRWSVNAKSGKVGVRAREVFPINSGDSDTESNFDDWLANKIGELYKQDVETAATQPQLTEILEDASIPNDVIEMILLRCDGETFEAIGDKVGLSKDAVRMRLNRVKESLSNSRFLRD